MKRSMKSEATRKHILDTSFELVLHKGFVGLGLQEILKACTYPKVRSITILRLKRPLVVLY